MTPRPRQADLSPAALAHLQSVLARPDLDGTAYTIGELLGSGGMGAVYRAHDARLDREVAIKVLHWPALGEAAAQGLLREARILATLDHPGIVPVYEVGTLPDGRAYYAMKLVGGSPIRSVLQAGMPLDSRLRLFERVCETVAFAHSKGVLHRDLKPSNIMVGPFGEVLVMDWGVARALGAPPAAGPVDASQPGAAGTPGYMAPEQLAGSAAGQDARIDVHALGAVLRFLVTGRDPMDATPPDGDAPKRLRSIWRRAMAGDPADRYGGALELANDVARFMAREPVSAYAENPLERLGRLVAKHRVAVLLILAYLAMRLALLWTYGR